jgi:hypothetical protein
MKDTKITDMEVNWLYSALIARQPIDPTHLMINRWCCETTSGLGDISLGCYLSMLAISMRPGIPRNSEHLLVGTSLGFDYMKQGKCISGDERGGFKLVKVNLPLPDARLRLFLEWKEDWLEEGLLVPAKKNKRGRIVEEGSSATQEEGAQQNYVPPFGGIPAPSSYCSGVPMLAWGSGAAMPPPHFAVPNVAFVEPYAHLPQPQQSVAMTGGYAARNMQNIATIQTNSNQMGEGNANITYELGRLHLAPPEQFIGGAVKSYYEQGYNNQYYQYQPPVED